MIIITHRDGFYPLEEVIFVAPRTTGEHVIKPEEQGRDLPLMLDPLMDPGLEELLIESKDDGGGDRELAMRIDADKIGPERRDQIVTLTGESGLYRKDIYLSPYGDGSVTGQRPIPMPRNTETSVYGPIIREDNSWRRLREGHHRTGEVVGWTRRHTSDFDGQSQSRSKES